MTILSICIPTFNRCGCLYFTLKSIVDQEVFQNTNDIEIVVSDNCSSDFTQIIVQKFIEKFPDKIKYNRNETNIEDKNFEKVLSLAEGEVLKLHNDNFVFIDGALDFILNKIKELRDEKPLIFFANHNSSLEKDFLCTDLNEFIQSASYLSTWIAAFSIWKEDFDRFKDFSQKVSTNLMQTDVLFRIISEGKNIFVCNEHIFEGRNVIKKGGYNQAKIFGQNYLNLLKEYLFDNKLDKKVYENEKKVLLLNHIIPMRFSVTDRTKYWDFKYNGYWRYLFKDYWYNLYFYISIIKIIRLVIDAKINILSRKLNKNSVQKYWRKRNSHNQTTINQNIDNTKVFVGKNCTGNIDAEFSDEDNEMLIISDGVIIGENVKFIFKDDGLIIIEEGIKIPPDSIISSSMKMRKN